jgi:LuxR family maltose regulon positive regulatory protein
MKTPAENSIETIIRPTLQKSFDEGYAEHQVILFSAPCGCGKTTAARELLKGRNFCEWNAAHSGFLKKKIPFACDAILIDNLQCLVKPEDRNQLCAMITGREDLHFILAGRCRPPGYLMVFKISGRMMILEMKNLFFDRDSTIRLLKCHGITPDAAEMNQILRDMKGYPLALGMLWHHLQDGKKYDESVYRACEWDVRVYLEEAVFSRFEKPVREFLLDIAPFEELTLELAKTVSGNQHAGEIFAMLETDTSMLIFEGPDLYRFHPVYRRSLLWASERMQTDAKRKKNLDRAALYYERQGNFEKALKFYSEAGNRNKVISLLIENAACHPGIGHYREMQAYYDTLSDQEIRRSPALMCIMSMLAAIRLDYESSEKWYGALKRYAAKRKKNDPEYREAAGKLIYLDIALPQRKSTGLIDVMRNAVHILAEGKVKIPAFSVTSTLPSIMNGGKDFCEWSKKDLLLYKTMRKPLEAVLGRDGVGLADCGFCESRFEKGYNVTDEMLGLMTRLGDIQARGTPDIEFAVIGLLARVQVSLGKSALAAESVENLRDKFEKTGEVRFLGNIDALLTRIWLRTGKEEAVREWLKKAPGKEVYLWSLWRYQYLTRAMAQIGEGEPEEAMLLLSRLLPYCKTIGRVMDCLHISVLTAICRYRMKDSVWKDELKSALDTSKEYDFVWPVAQYGAAVLPLLKTCGWGKNKAFLKKLTDAAKKQAVYYPRFLQERTPPTELLSSMETKVLRLVCQNLSNAEIGEVMGIRLPTVKTHVSNIFQKLDVKNRNEAKAAAEKLNLL